MNEHDQSTPPPLLSTPQNSPAPASAHTSWWRKLFACNPFYLVSAGLLLFGCYRISSDTIWNETAQLLFNFSSVQLYEILLVFTAIFLARRRIWYDSTLLVGLENLLVFVPFILISQAALIDSHLAGAMCLAGALAAIMRFGALKNFLAQLNLPWRVLGMGFSVLALNVALPLVFRHFGETKLGVNIESGPAYAMNEYAWLLILPAAFALANFLPYARESGDLLPQRRWLPAAAFLIWLAATCIHLYSIDYVYQFRLRGELFAPALWILAWTLYRIVSNNFEFSFPQLKTALVILPVAIPLLAASHAGNYTLPILAAANLMIYCAVAVAGRHGRFVWDLAFVSTLQLIGGMPEMCFRAVAPELTQWSCLVAALLGYLVLWTVLLPNPKLAIFGAVAFGCAVLAVLGHHPGAAHWALQSGLAFLLVHSLCWNDREHQGAMAVRIVVSLAWVAQSFVWMHSENARAWMPCVFGALVWGIYGLVQLVRGKWARWVIPVAATCVMLSGPVSATADGARVVPAGLLAIAGSFALFACGTIAALTRHLWHPRGNTGDDHYQTGASNSSKPEVP